MKRTALLYGVLLAFAAFPLAAQQAPDNDAILRETIDKGSPYYYPAIYMRYMSGDTTLTLEDYRHLYYGYAWQPGYKPFETPAAKDRILNILAKDSLAEADYLKIVEYGREVMRSEPYDPSTLNFLVYAYGAVGDSVNERINLPSERDFGGYRVIGRRAQRTVALACSLLFSCPRPACQHESGGRQGESDQPYGGMDAPACQAERRQGILFRFRPHLLAQTRQIAREA